MTPKPVVVLSRCLGECACRYDGQALRDPHVARMADFVEFKTVCPERDLGLGVPRDPIRLMENGRGTVRLVQPATGRDLTEEMRTFASRFLDRLEVADGFLLKSRSPSCGVRDVKIRSADGKRVIRRGAGIFAAAVLERFPGSAVEDEERFKDPRIRDHFLTRIFTNARFRAVRSMSELVAFHAAHKLLLQVYRRSAMKDLERIAANSGRLPFPRVRERYREELGRALASPARTASRIHVLEHVFRCFFDKLPPARRCHLRRRIVGYRESGLPAGALILLLRTWVERFQNPDPADPALTEPYPRELMSLQDPGKGRVSIRPFSGRPEPPGTRRSRSPGSANSLGP